MNPAIQTREEFLTELAHELRNPLASIMSSIELMQALGQHSEEVPSLLETVNQKVRDMTAVIDDLFVSPPDADVPAVQAALRVLVVDDNVTAANSLAQILTLRGYEVAAAYGGEQGFETARTFLPQAAILDIGMPDIDGYALAKLIHSMDSSCTLIALTGYGQERDKEAAAASGFAYHLTKPTGIKDIEVILKKIATQDAKK
jgi:CheY-like chemotaxis protein